MVNEGVQCLLRFQYNISSIYVLFLMHSYTSVFLLAYYNMIYIII